MAVSSPRPSVILFSKTQFYFVKEGKERKCTRGEGRHVRNIFSAVMTAAAFTYKLTLLSDVSRENALGN